MSKTDRWIKVEKDGKIYHIDLYDSPRNTAAGAGEIEVGGRTLYYSYTGVLENTVVGGPTPVRFEKDGKTYQVTEKGEFYIKINPTQLQKIVCRLSNGYEWNSDDNSEKWVPFGTSFTAWMIKTHQKYRPGTLNLTSGVLETGNIVLSATPAERLHL